MNWMKRARREIAGYASRPTANTAERNATAVTAVPRLFPREVRECSIGSNGSTALAQMQAIEAARGEFDEGAAIVEFDGDVNGEDAEREVWALMRRFHRLH